MNTFILVKIHTSASGSVLIRHFVLPAHRRMRNVTNYFLVNLAVADLGMATLNCIPGFIFMRDRWEELGISCLLHETRDILNGIYLFIYFIIYSILILLYEDRRSTFCLFRDVFVVGLWGVESRLLTLDITLYGRQWIFGSVYCSVNSFTSSLTVSVSVFTLLALTIERYKVRASCWN